MFHTFRLYHHKTQNKLKIEQTPLLKHLKYHRSPNLLISGILCNRSVVSRGVLRRFSWALSYWDVECHHRERTLPEILF